MAKTDREVVITDKVSMYFTAFLTLNDGKDKFSLGIKSKETGLISFDGGDYYECCFKLRTFLEEKGLFILIKASSIYVYPSRMARDMSNGLQAYSLILGKKASMEQVINIFDQASVEEVGTINEQESFFEEWRNTPKS